jgi:hypothetical protein
MGAERLVRLEANAATLMTETPLAQLSNMFQRLLFKDWRVGAAIPRLNPGQRELYVLRYTLSWQ